MASDRYELIDCVRNPREPKYIELKQEEIELIEERLSKKQKLSPPRQRFQFIELNQSREIEDDDEIIKRKEAAQREERTKMPKP